jgi:ethanolamine-phosphate cytidylyltransferase
MNLHERVLSVLSCRYVDDVLIDAPYEVTPEMIASLRIAEVVHGTNSDDIGILTSNNNNNGNELYDERYKCPKEAGIFTMIQSPNNFKLGSIVRRIRKNQDAFQAKVDRKRKAENEFYREKYSKKKEIVANMNLD